MDTERKIGKKKQLSESQVMFSFRFSQKTMGWFGYGVYGLSWV